MKLLSITRKKILTEHPEWKKSKKRQNVEPSKSYNTLPGVDRSENANYEKSPTSLEKKATHYESSSDISD